MSYSLVVAGRIVMSGEDFETWLDPPAPATAIIENSGDMFAGWYGDDRERPEDWSDAGTGATPRDLLAGRNPDGTITRVAPGGARFLVSTAPYGAPTGPVPAEAAEDR